MSSITLTVNGKPHTVDVDPTTPLLYVLSDDLALRGPKFGCGLGQCGSCTVIVRRASDPIVRHAGQRRRWRGDHDARGTRHDRATASDSEGLHRRAGRAVRLLPERRDSHGEGVSRSEPESDRRRDSAGDVDGVVPMLYHTFACFARSSATRQEVCDDT